MTIQLIHVSDIHFGSGEGHGHVNPASGLNTRFEDFASALARVVDYTIKNQCDVFLFSGDAYRNASPEPVYQKIFAAELKRLSDAGVKTILLVGNHDQILKSTASHSMSVFQSLEVPGVLTIDRPVFTTIDTAGGAFQLIGLPHVTRQQLLTSDKYLTMPAAAVDKVLIKHIGSMLSNYYDELDPAIPAVVTAHMTLDRAIAGIEQELLIGYTLTFPCDIFVDKRLDYVALGHVHKHQTIRDKSPAIVYAGSLERVDFGEQEEDKGFIHVKLARGRTSWKFHSINPRPFVTIDSDLRQSKEITGELCRLVKEKLLPGAVLRIRYKINPEQLDELDQGQVRLAASQAASVRLQPEVVQGHSRARLPQLKEDSILAPLSALETYLKEIAPERKDKLVKLASELMDELSSSQSG